MIEHTKSYDVLFLISRYMKRKEILAELTEELSRSLMGKNAYLKRVGNVFFRSGDAACVQRDVVFYSSRRHKFCFELINMDSSYFTGTKENAMALQEAFGGKIYPTEYTAVENPMNLWVWEGPLRYAQLHKEADALDFETVKAVLFDEA